MNFSQIENFIQAAESLSFSEAAKRLFISQSALSRSIISIETELNMQLFIRENNKIRLTPAGKVLLEGFKEVRYTYNHWLEQAQIAHRGIEGTLRIGLLEEQMLEDEVFQAFNEFRLKYPSIQLIISKNSFSNLQSGLMDGELDMMLSLEHAFFNHPEWESLFIKEHRLNLVVRKGNPLAELDEIDLCRFPDLLKNQVMLGIDYQESKESFDIMHEDFKSVNFHPNYKFAPSAGLLALWVESGIGVTVFNDNHALVSDPRIAFIPIRNIRSSCTYIGWNRNFQNPCVDKFLEVLKHSL